MANCDLCNTKLNWMDERRIQMDSENLCVCKSCESCIKILQGEWKEEHEVDDSVKCLSEIIQKGGLKGKQAERINSLIAGADKLKRVRAAEKKKADIVEARKKQGEENREENKIFFMKTTGYGFDGYKIIDYLDVVTGEAVMGTGFLTEITASVEDAFGTTSTVLRIS